MAVFDKLLKKDWFNVGAIIFLMWGAINSWFGISRYGFEQGMYFWFCNLALFAVAYGVWRKNPSWLIAWLSFALFTQSFWILDNFWRLITRKNLLGLVEFMYQPGYPIDEFLSSHYHFFIIPTIVVALLYIKQINLYAKRVAVACSIFAFGLSYFLFPPEQNINCIRESCIPLLNLKGPLYSITFFIVVTFLGVIGAHFIEKLYKRISLKSTQKKVVVYLFFIIIIISIVFIAIDVAYKKMLPSFKCIEPFENSEIKIQCKFNAEFKDEKMWLVYTIANKLPAPKICSSKINLNGYTTIMHENLYLEPHKTYNIEYILPYPKREVKAKLTASCN